MVCMSATTVELEGTVVGVASADAGEAVSSTAEGGGRFTK